MLSLRPQSEQVDTEGGFVWFTCETGKIVLVNCWCGEGWGFHGNACERLVLPQLRGLGQQEVQTLC